MQAVGNNDNAEETCLKNRGATVSLAKGSSSPPPSNNPDENLEQSGPGSHFQNLDDNPRNSTTSKENLERGVLQNAPDSPSDESFNKEAGDEDFPEGGLKGWSVVVGSFCGSFAVFGILNSSGILLEYFSTHQLKGYDTGQLGWIFGLSLFLTFFCGAPIGPIFDAYGPRVLIFCGSILLVSSMMLLGLCTQLWHFFVVYSALNGIGGCLVNTPCIAAIGHYFLVKRGNATGVAMTAGSIGGIIFPLMLQRLFPTIGFAWTTRILGFILLFLLVIANLLVQSRLPRKKLPSIGSILPDLNAFRDLPFFFITIAIFFLEWGIFVPLTYITPYVVSHGQSYSFGFYIVAILNAGSFVGRFGAGWAADLIGRLNTLILSVALCVIACLALWLPASNSTAMAVIFALIFGVVSGSNLSLSPVCVGQMCKTENYGRYYSTCWMVVAFGTLTGLPIAGKILTASGGDYTWMIVFAGLSYALAGFFLIAARVLAVGWSLQTVY